VRIFGWSMRSWSHHMPRGVHLKSEGFASDDEAPILDRRFESSVPGLYFVGAAAANS
jgi:hypothetical protein